jgi:hypothetical protein
MVYAQGGPRSFRVFQGFVLLAFLANQEKHMNDLVGRETDQ